jgi:hypothetical protein
MVRHSPPSEQATTSAAAQSSRLLSLTSSLAEMLLKHPNTMALIILFMVISER